MSFLNIEIKAACQDADPIRNFLLRNGDFRGTDLQTDTYFNVQNGRLKLREGAIENNLIYYERNDQAGPKSSRFHLVSVADPPVLKEVLTRSLGIKVIVKKQRSIFFIENIKFHIDEVEGLGQFIEIEASNKYADLSEQRLQIQCDHYRKEFHIRDEDLIAVSYSDLLLASFTK